MIELSHVSAHLIRIINILIVKIRFLVRVSRPEKVVYHMSRLFHVRPLYRSMILGLLALSLSACAGMSAREPVVGDDIAGAHELDGDLLYELLAAEFSGVRGDFEESVDHYLAAAKASDDPQVAARAAHVAVYSGHYAEALAALERWQQLGAQAEETARIRALAHMNLENLEPALEAIDQLLVSDGKVEDQAVGALGHIIQKEAKPAFALVLLEHLNQRHPDNMRLMLLKARLEANAGHFEEALVSVENVISLAPDTSDAYLIKAQVLAGQGLEEEAVLAVAQAVEHRPDDNRLRMQYARMLVQMKSYELAWEQFAVLHEAMPDNHNVLLSLGLLSIEIDRSDLARQYLQQLIDRGFHNSQAHYYLGRIQQNDNEVMAAIANYGRVQSGDFLVDARIREAGLLAQIGKIDEALEKLQRLSQMSDDNNNQIRVYLAQGEVLRRADRDREALTIYNNALKDAPENVDLLYARALTAERLDMLDITESDLRMVLAHEPDNANALNALGYTLADRTERLQEAKAYILKAAELLPDDPAVLDSLGWVYFRLGELEKAIDWLRKAFARLEDAEIAAHLGEALWVNGQLEEAGKVWQRGLQIDADHPLLLDTIKRLKK